MMTYRTQFALVANSSWLAVVVACGGRVEADAAGVTANSTGGVGTSTNAGAPSGLAQGGTSAGTTSLRGSSAGGVTLVAGNISTGGTGVCGSAACDFSQYSCGVIFDACGLAVDCGMGHCANPILCGAVEANICLQCAPTNCADQGKDCGFIPDGCGGSIDCGTCASGECCGCGGVANVCGSGGPCRPLTCDDYPNAVGPRPDGCGGTTAPCPCTPLACEQICPAPDGGLGRCSSISDPIVYPVACPEPDGCKGIVNCYCLVN